MPIYSAYNMLFLSFSDFFLLLLLYCMLLRLPPIGSNCLTNRARLTIFISIFIVLILLLNWIFLFVLKLVEADSGGLAYKAGYVGHKYAIIAGMLEIK